MFIKEIELSVIYGQGRLIHILGLGIDPNDITFKRIYEKYRITRAKKLETVFDGLKKQGIKPNISEMGQFATGGWLDRQAIVKWLVANRYADTVVDAWIKIIDHIPYVEGELIEPEEAFYAIKKSGGLSFLAHYHKWIGFHGYSKFETEKRLIELKAMGLDGIERYYPSFTQTNEEEVDYYMEKFKLIPSGGSDYHGKNRPNIELGIGEGNFSVPDEIVENINRLRD